MFGPGAQSLLDCGLTTEINTLLWLIISLAVTLLTFNGLRKAFRETEDSSLQRVHICLQFALSNLSWERHTVRELNWVTAFLWQQTLSFLLTIFFVLYLACHFFSIFLLLSFIFRITFNLSSICISNSRDCKGKCTYLKIGTCGWVLFTAFLCWFAFVFVKIFIFTSFVEWPVHCPLVLLTSHCRIELKYHTYLIGVKGVNLGKQFV